MMSIHQASTKQSWGTIGRSSGKMVIISVGLYWASISIGHNWASIEDPPGTIDRLLGTIGNPSGIHWVLFKYQLDIRGGGIWRLGFPQASRIQQVPSTIHRPSIGHPSAIHLLSIRHQSAIHPPSICHSSIVIRHLSSTSAKPIYHPSSTIEQPYRDNRVPNRTPQSIYIYIYICGIHRAPLGIYEALIEHHRASIENHQPFIGHWFRMIRDPLGTIWHLSGTYRISFGNNLHPQATIDHPLDRCHQARLSIIEESGTIRQHQTALARRPGTIGYHRKASGEDRAPSKTSKRQWAPSGTIREHRAPLRTIIHHFKHHRPSTICDYQLLLYWVPSRTIEFYQGQSGTIGHH